MKQYAGIWVLLLKLGPKLVSVGTKLIKSFSVTKFGLAAGSVTVYSVLFSWEFALALVAMLFFHEMGHIWAMKRVGMRVKGIYIIPFFGAVALGDDDFPSWRAEAFVALMGPVWGLCFSLASAVIFVFGGGDFWAATAAFMAMINLFNLLPINPLDGGRVLKSMAFSVNGSFGLAVMFFGLAGAMLFSYFTGFMLVLMLSVVGAIEIWAEWKQARALDPEGQKPRMERGELAETGLFYVGLAAILFGVMEVAGSTPEAALARELFR